MDENNKVEFGDLAKSWQIELPDTLPPNEIELVQKSRALSQSITQHKPVNRDQSWDDVCLNLLSKRTIKKTQPEKQWIYANNLKNIFRVIFVAFVTVIKVAFKFLYFVLSFLIVSGKKNRKRKKNRKFPQRIHSKKKTNKPKRRISSVKSGLSKDKFVPTTNMYCNSCSKKLGLKAFENQGKYYCAKCNSKY